MQEPRLDNEQELLQQIATGSEEAFRTLYESQKKRLYGYVVSITRSGEMADDIIQEIFLKIWSMREKLSGIENIGGYLQRMAQNQSIKAFQLLAVKGLIADHLQQQESGTLADDKLISKEVQQYIHHLVEQLTPSQRRVFLLSREEGLRQQEIADRLGISLITVKKHMVDALKTIREALFQRYGTLAIALFVLFRINEY